MVPRFGARLEINFPGYNHVQAKQIQRAFESTISKTVLANTPDDIVIRCTMVPDNQEDLCTIKVENPYVSKDAIEREQITGFADLNSGWKKACKQPINPDHSTLPEAVLNTLDWVLQVANSKPSA